METRGSAGTFQAVSGSLERYMVWCSAPNAVSDPANATGLNILTTGDIRDATQKNFEILVQSIALRASPVILQEPTAVLLLEDNNAQVLTGEGFVWCFATERDEQFLKDSNPVQLLIDDLNGIVLPTGAVVITSGAQQNIEFMRQSTLC